MFEKKDKQGHEHSTESKKIELNPKIMEKVGSSKGFMCFIAFLTDKKDENGNFIIEYEYQRQFFPKGDMPDAVICLRNFCENDMWKGIRPSGHQH